MLLCAYESWYFAKLRQSYYYMIFADLLRSYCLTTCNITIGVRSGIRNEHYSFSTLVAMLEEQQRQRERLERLLQHHEHNQCRLQERQLNTSQQMEMLREDVGSLKTPLHD